MTSSKQTEANRRNALKSTGPRTPQGKKCSSGNALKHGILSRELLLPDEDHGVFDKLHQGLYQALQPVGLLEELMVERMACAFWRQRRFGPFESELIMSAYLDKMRQNAWLARGAREDQSGPPMLGEAFSSGACYGDVFTKLARYEAHIERSGYKALHELQRLQAIRSGSADSGPQDSDALPQPALPG